MKFTKIKMDVNGNSRVVVHYTNIADTYQEAIKLANKIGGRKFHNKQYGGGIVFQLTTETELERAIERVRHKPTPQSHIVGRYNIFGYAVYDLDAGIQLYAAGNAKYESTTYVDINSKQALGLQTIKEMCEQTTREMAEESGDIYTGIEIDDSGEIP